MHARLMVPYVVDLQRMSDDDDSVEQSKRQVRVSRICDDEDDAARLHGFEGRRKDSGRSR
ncbi:uncharacterized protein B0H18DRAFT_1019221 [Fomitopsis serialis]|uniref:uncharacterized protein n=1 Tax=Fomitopsis serialis TaxID=139415 RepID=UPI0020074E13|nr:uncharacterized protein B0H18DRAFT_1019221 [Neoantrodia serialis]KAH9922121.1 hypothetical protein B0H18DRAFT_1019221 [Neoantrodia serialis]